MNYQKTLVSFVMGLSLGLDAGVTSANSMVSITSWTLTDFNGDGLQSDFSFYNSASGNSDNVFGSGDEICSVISISDNVCGDILFDGYNSVGFHDNGPDTFTTGFNFEGGGVFSPIIFGSMSATIDRVAAARGDGIALQFSALDFGGIYQDSQLFHLSPDHLQNCTGENVGAFGGACGEGAIYDDNPLLSNPLGYNVEITFLGTRTFSELDHTFYDYQYGIVINYVSTINNAFVYGNPVPTIFEGDEANFRLEGIMHTREFSPVLLPVPASVWLFGVGMLSLVGVARRKYR